MSQKRYAAVAAMAIVIAAVSGAGTFASADDDDGERGVQKASALLADASGVTIGRVRFEQDGTMVHIEAKVRGLTPGKHGIHIHAVGACAPTFAAAGPHHNPQGALHGGHGGDLPNLVVGANGKGEFEAVTSLASLSAGTLSVFDRDGSAVVIHANEDDLVTNPSGNSGARIACGVIVAG